MKVSSKQEIIKRIQQNNAVIKAMGISSIGLFGSFVKNEASENSDVDLLIEFEHKLYTCCLFP
jgi:uncharacterized protein